MKLARNAMLMELCGLPLLGNVVTGEVIGLTEECWELCCRMRIQDVRESEVRGLSEPLADRLIKGGFAEGCENADPYGSFDTIYLHVTQRCNLECKYCYSRTKSRNRLPDPSSEAINHFVQFIQEAAARRVVISGGEPFLRDDLSGIVELIKLAGVSCVEILSNGLLITKEKLNPLVGLVDRIAIAYDGASSQSMAFLRGKQYFAELNEAIASIQDAGIVARMLPTLHGHNVSDIETYEALARKRGAECSFSLLTGPKGELGDYALSDDQQRYVAVMMAQRLSEDRLFSSAPPLEARRSCGAGNKQLSIDADGTVYPCHMLHRAEYVLGNAARDSFIDVMNGEALRCFRRHIDRALSNCEGCKIRYLCGGGLLRKELDARERWVEPRPLLHYVRCFL